MAAYDFPDTAGKPTDGSFEYTAPDGTLYEWNGYAWVVPADESSGGGGGGAARVLTQVLPPSPAEDGDMYWCTDDGRLYLYYDDADTKQWVDASPDGGGSSAATYWDRNGTTLSPSNAGDDVEVDGTGRFTSAAGLYVDGRLTVGDASGAEGGAASGVRLKYTGQTFLSGPGTLGLINIHSTGNSDAVGTWDASGSIKIGNTSVSPNITLDADGSGSFAQPVVIGNDPLVANNGVRIANSGGIITRRDTGTNNNPCFVALKGGGNTTADNVIRMNFDGSAEFKGDGAQTIQIRPTLADGSSAYALRLLDSTGKAMWNLVADGDAFFDGAITADNVTFKLEADDDTKYTATTDSQGEQTLVYNGATLDVKALLLNLQTAAARIATLEAKVQTLESDHTTLMNNNNNNGGGY